MAHFSVKGGLFAAITALTSIRSGKIPNIMRQWDCGTPRSKRKIAKQIEIRLQEVFFLSCHQYFDIFCKLIA